MGVPKVLGGVLAALRVPVALEDLDLPGQDTL